MEMSQADGSQPSPHYSNSPSLHHSACSPPGYSQIPRDFRLAYTPHSASVQPRMNRFAPLFAAAAVWGAAVASAPGQTSVPTVRFQFREPRRQAYRVETPAGTSLRTMQRSEWLKAFPDDGSTNSIELGCCVILQVAPGTDVAALLRDRPLQTERNVGPNLFILRGPDAWTALREAERLAGLPGVHASVPDRRRRLSPHGPYAPAPNDTYFSDQWHLENRDTNGLPLGPDLNIRAAWPFTRGEGILIAQADDGIELAHPDLTNRLHAPLHFNFINASASGAPMANSQIHGTAVAGLIAAERGNGRGVSGTAPGARLSSWIIFGPGSVASDVQFMDMFQYASNTISVQNHSWGNADPALLGPSLVEQVALSNAFTLGRGGRGVVMVRSGGNNREVSGDVNDDGYANDPRAITVAAVRDDGRAATYSNPGACLLVGAPSGDGDTRTLTTTDRLGTLGYNFANYANDFGDYASQGSGFSGTSGAAPQITGVVALLLAANTNLALRDVQQILLLSARHFDFADPGLRTNSAGLRVSHNVGFGVPDAGEAVRLARLWSNRPPATNLTWSAANTVAIPNEGLRLVTAGGGVPANLLSAICRPGLGPHADAPTAALPLVDVGLALAPLTNDLAGKAALIQRGTNFFADKIAYAAQAGAAFAVIYNRPGGDNIVALGGTEYSPIPAVFLSQADGEALRDYVQTNAAATAQIVLNAATYSFTVTNTLACEHIGVRVRASHPRRGDLRITLTSPRGTRSVLQHLNSDTSAGPDDWTYYSTQHFFEASAGTWTVAVSDEGAGFSGSVLGVDLLLSGVPLTDTDNDGLDDGWEMARLGTLATGPADDADGDGYTNLREQVMGTNPASTDEPFPFLPDLSVLNARLLRVSWPAVTNLAYEVRGATNVLAPLTAVTNAAGRFPEAEVFLPYTNGVNQFLRVRTLP